MTARCAPTAARPSALSAIVYGAAVTTDSAAPNAASAFVKFMTALENRPVWKESRFEAPTNLNSN
jgi:ABC-type molybdate transport system substrate-binding protein